MATLNTEPELYALLHQGTPGDEAFYMETCSGAESILEFGCGHGRLLLALARAGHRITGIDVDDGLLTLARSALARHPATASRTILHHGDMRTMALDEQFDRVIIAYNTLYCLESEADQVSCLTNAARHLSPGGRLVFDAYAIDTFHFEADEDEDGSDDEAVAMITWRDTVWDVYEHCDWSRAAQRLDVRYTCEPRNGGPALHQRIDHRYLLTAQLPEICSAAGLQIERLTGGFRGEPLNGESEHLACTATLA